MWAGNRGGKRMTYEHNCFSCSGKQTERKCYESTINREYCNWRIVADNDLIKYERGHDNITLRTMLEDYLAAEETKIISADELSKIIRGG